MTPPEHGELLSVLLKTEPEILQHATYSVWEVISIQAFTEIETVSFYTYFNWAYNPKRVAEAKHKRGHRGNFTRAGSWCRSAHYFSLCARWLFSI